MSDLEKAGHPAWREILDVLPESLHSVVKPVLQKWDDGVKARFDEINAKYEPYKQLVENKIDPEAIITGLNLSHQFQTDPASVVKQAIEAFELDFVTQEEYDQALASVSDDDNSYDSDDSFENDPRFKQMNELVLSMKETIDKQEQERRNQTEQSKLDQTLAKLEEEHGSFDKMYVMTMIANGLDGATAVKQYQDTIDQAVAARVSSSNNGNNSNEDGSTPVVLGNNQGGEGSGLPDNPVQLGEMKTSDINQLVEQMLAQSNGQE